MTTDELPEFSDRGEDGESVEDTGGREIRGG
jgi:hypothetical protein